MGVDAYTDAGAAGILLYITRVRSTSGAAFHVYPPHLLSTSGLIGDIL